MVSANQINLRQFDPFFVGFDRMWDEIDRLQQSTGFTGKGGYPPYNIVRHDPGGSDTKFSIEMAVAGFSESEIEVILQEDVLTIKGKVSQDSNGGSEIIHQGIAARNFDRRFTLSESIEVTGCKLENGMLVVDLEKLIPEEKKPWVVPINDPKSLSRNVSKRKLLTE